MAANEFFWQLQNSDRELMRLLKCRSPAGRTGVSPRRMGTLATDLQCSFGSIPQPMGWPIKASHPVNERAHIRSHAGRGSCARLEGGDPGAVRGGLPRVQDVASALNHKTNSALPDCVGGSRDLP